MAHNVRVTPSPDTPDSPAPDTRTPGEWLRYVPPVAALSVAYVLQTIVITDMVGGALADRLDHLADPIAWYGLALMLGIAVASTIEAGAAYLLWLYDRHLRARDSVLLLRLGMLGLVSVSAVVIHWWLGHRGLPELVAWVLAGMSGLALWLWSRGSRWKQRQEMIAAGQIDPALPRLPVVAKVLHPVRWIITLFLISWEPASTTDEARARYRQWRDGPHWWRRTPHTPARADRPVKPKAPRPEPDPGQPDGQLAPVRNITSRTGGRRKPRRGEVSDEDLARELDRSYPDRVPGVPTAMPHLRRVFGSCSRARASAAVKLVSAWRNGGQADEDDLEGARWAAA